MPLWAMSRHLLPPSGYPRLAWRQRHFLVCLGLWQLSEYLSAAGGLRPLPAGALKRHRLGGGHRLRGLLGHGQRQHPGRGGQQPGAPLLFVPELINGNDFTLIVRTTCLAYTVRHHKFTALAAFYKVRSAHLPVGSSFISSCL